MKFLNLLQYSNIKTLSKCYLQFIHILAINFSVVVLSACDPGGELSPQQQVQLKTVARNQSVFLSWDQAQGAQYYKIYYSETNVIDKNKTPYLESTSNSIVIENLQNDKTYYFSVSSVSDSGESELINIVSSTPKPPPIAPQKLNIEIGSESVTINWDKIDNDSSYNLYMSRSPGISVENYDLLSGWMVRKDIKSPFTQTGLINGINYYFVLTSENERGESVVSQELQATPTQTLTTSMGKNHACSVLIDNSLWCWGGNYVGQLGDGSFVSKFSPVQIGENELWRDVSAGVEHTCALTTEDKLWCWGNNSHGQIDIELESKINLPVELKSDDKTWRQVSAGGSISCGILNNQRQNLECWGEYRFLPVLDESVLNSSTEHDTLWASVELGNSHFCAIKTDSNMWCWGEDELAQLGDGNIYYYEEQITNVLSIVEEPDNWQSLAIGDNGPLKDSAHSCGIKKNGNLWCWGSDRYTPLNPFGFIENRGNLKLVGSENFWQVIAAGYRHDCGIDSFFSLYCWGALVQGQLNRPNVSFVSEPVRMQEDDLWVDVIANHEQTCATRVDGSIFCTGRNQFGQLGNGGSAFEKLPHLVKLDMIDVVAHGDHACATDENNSVWCWGGNEYRQVDDDTSIDKQTPQQILYGTPLTSLTIARNQNCALNISLEMECWGFSKYIWIISAPDPQEIIDDPNANADLSEIALGELNRCALKTNGTLWCIATFSFLESVENHFEVEFLQGPVLKQVEVEGSFEKISLGGNQACVIDEDKRLWCWGINEYGELGTQNIESYDIPQKLDSELQWQTIAVAKNHVCGIDVDENLWCWGNNEYGQLGDRSFDNRNQATAVVSDIGWVHIYVSDTRSCGIKKDNSLWCWGQNLPSSNDEFDSDLGNSFSPTQIAEQHLWNKVSMGDRFICAIDTENSLYCWGDNTSGSLGNGKAWSSEWNKVKFPNTKIILQ